MIGQRFNIEAPWRWDNETSLVLTVHDRDLLGSHNHFIRFDLYPKYAPAHPERHIGCWDLPMDRVKSAPTELVYRKGRLFLKGFLRSSPVPQIWKGKTEALGYCDLHVSLQQKGEGSSMPPEVTVSAYIIPEGHRDVPMVSAHVPITQRCNLLCPMCSPRRTLMDHSDVADAVLQPLVEIAPDLLYVQLQGIGEPLLNKNLPNIAYAFRKRMPVEGRLAVLTNATLLDRDTAAGLIDLGMNSLVFSIDGATKTVYERVRRGADFDSVISNISQAVAYGRRTGRKDLWFSANYVIMAGNVQEIPAMVELAASLGLDCVSFCYMKDLQAEEIRVLGEDNLVPLFAAAAEAGKRLGVGTVFPLCRGSDENRCPFMQYAFFGLNGDMAPCCRFKPWSNGEPRKVFGNVLDKPVLEIWNSPEYVEFRRRIVAGDMPEECAECYFANGLANA